MTLDDWDQLNQRLEAAVASAARAPDHTRLDLGRMGRRVRELLRSADSERVKCRRRRTNTQQYQALIAAAGEALTNFEGHVIMALLLKEHK